MRKTGGGPQENVPGFPIPRFTLIFAAAARRAACICRIARLYFGMSENVRRSRTREGNGSFMPKEAMNAND